MARVAVVVSDQTFERELLPKNTLGRHPDNTLQISDPTVSMRHCAIEQRGERFVVWDLGSRNGTLVNGQRVESERVLRHGDVIRIGDTKVRYYDEHEPSVGAAPTREEQAAEQARRARAAFEQSAEVGPAAVAAVVKAFEAEGLAAPPVPESLVPRLRVQGNWVFATHPQLYPPYHWAAFVDPPGPDEEYLVIGHSGHGANSYAVFYGLRVGPLCLLLEIPWGGVYMDPVDGRCMMRETFAAAAELIDAVDVAVRTGRMASSSRLSVYASFLVENCSWRISSAGEAVRLEPEGSHSGTHRGPGEVLAESLAWVRALPDPDAS
jgi:hypothetical protein